MNVWFTGDSYSDIISRASGSARTSPAVFASDAGAGNEFALTLAAEHSWVSGHRRDYSASEFIVRTR